MTYLKNALLFVFMLINAPCYADTNNIVLPLNFDSGNSAPYGMASTVVNIQGKKIPLLFDLGASKDFIVLKPAALKKIKVHFTGKKTCSMSVSGKFCLRDFIIPKMVIGNLVLKNVPGAFADHMWGGNPVKKHRGAFQFGVIGMKFLEKFDGVLIDYSKATAILSKSCQLPSQYSREKWISIPFKIHGGVEIDANINGHPAKLILDTGAVPSVIGNKNTFGSKIKNCYSYLPYPSPCKMIVTKTFSINSYPLKNTWFSLAPIPSAAHFTGLLGDNFFRNNVVYIDFKHRKILIMKNA